MTVTFKQWFKQWKTWRDKKKITDETGLRESNNAC